MSLNFSSPGTTVDEVLTIDNEVFYSAEGRALCDGLSRIHLEQKMSEVINHEARRSTSGPMDTQGGTK
jgi:hypothetical protein